MQQLSKYPFDCDELRKGDTLSEDFICQTYKVAPRTEEYRHAVFNAKTHIQREFASRGEHVEVCEIKRVIHILTTEEAAGYTERQFSKGVRKMYDAHRRKTSLDRSEMTDETREIHDLQLTRQGRIVSAVKRANRRAKDLEPRPHARSTPILNSSEDEA